MIEKLGSVALVHVLVVVASSFSATGCGSANRNDGLFADNDGSHAPDGGAGPSTGKDGTGQGAGRTEPCIGLTCSQPPAAMCVGATTRRTFGASGTCDNGACTYLASDVACPAPANATPLCVTGACDFECRDGFMRAGSGCAFAHNTWAAVPDMPTWRYSLSAATGLDGRIYAIGGVGVGGEYMPTVEAYTPSTNTWTALASMSEGRGRFAAVTAADGRIYAIGGTGGAGPSVLATVEAYNPATNQWAPVTSMPAGRSDHGAAAGADGRIYALGGWEEGHAFWEGTAEAYNPMTRLWNAVPTMPAGHSVVQGTSGLDGKVYGILGLDKMYVYTPRSAMWTEAPGPTARTDLAVATGLDGRIYALGGRSYASSSGTNVAIAEVYSAGHWSPVASMHKARAQFAATTGLDGRIYALGGVDRDGKAMASVEAYTP